MKDRKSIRMFLALAALTLGFAACTGDAPNQQSGDAGTGMRNPSTENDLNQNTPPSERGGQQATETPSQNMSNGAAGQ